MLFVGGGLISIGDLKSDGDVALYVQTNGVHTDLCLPVKTDFFDWGTVIPSTDFSANENFEFISIGWGDKGFFLDTPEWSDLTFGTAFNAAFLPSGTAMHVQYLLHEPILTNSRAKIFVDKDDYKKLARFVKESFKLIDNKVQLIPNKGYWDNDNFYEANGNYHLFKTCNSWTNDALKLIGVKTGWYALSSEGVMSHLK